MTVYNVGGTVAVLGISEGAALALLREKGRNADMDVIDERVTPSTPGPEPLGYIASGEMVGLFEAESEEAAMGRFLHWVFSRSGALAKDVDVFESEDVPREWVR